MKNLSCFKAYDIRGIVPQELDIDMAYIIGAAYADILKPRKVIVGYDIRLDSKEFSESVTQGLIDSGVDVINIGMCGTEEVYFNVFNRMEQNVDGGIMITASHNPKNHNGMKMVKKSCIPMSIDDDLKKIRDYVANIYDKNQPVNKINEGKKGQIFYDDNKSSYINHLLSYIEIDNLKPLKILVNPGNGCAGPVIRLLEKFLPFNFIYLHEQPNGNFPNGIPNPMIKKNRIVTSQAVLEHKADLAIAWDGDFDRCFFFDESGKFIDGYYVVGLLAKSFLTKYPNETIVYDPRLTWNSIDIISKFGGKGVQSKSGHSYIKKIMRQEKAIYGGEMSAHHYFREFGYSDSGMIPWLLITELLSKTGLKMSDLVEDSMKKYPCSGEINYRVNNVNKVMEFVSNYFQNSDAAISFIDGVSVEFEKWRFNLRASNTEPLLRLNIEIKSEDILISDKIKELDYLINTRSK